MKVSSIFDPTQKQTTYQTTSSRSTTLVKRQELTASVYKKTQNKTLFNKSSHLSSKTKRIYFCVPQKFEDQKEVFWVQKRRKLE